MKNKKKTLIVILASIIIVAFVLSFIPRIRVNLFVNCYHSDIEESLSNGNGVPSDETLLFGYKSVNTWDNKHPMTEFIIMSYGFTYYGCYYSKDDVPLSFQNTDVELIQTEDNKWEWKAEGDNKGSTSKIMKNWYYFEASF